MVEAQAYSRWLKLVNDPRITAAIVIAIGLLLFSPYIISGQHVAIPEHDYLDQIDRLGTFKDGKLVEPSWHPFRWLAHHAGFFQAYVINELAYRVVAFFGMFLLAKRLTRQFEFPVLFLALTACAFAALPFWPQGRLSVAGIPLALFAALNLTERKHIVASCAVLGFHALGSSLVLSGLFLIATLSIFLLYEVTRGRWHPWLALGILLLGAAYALSSASLFDVAASTLGGESSRSEFKPSAYRGDKLQRSVERMVELATRTHLHARSNHRQLILPSLIACVAYLFARERLQNKRLVLGFLVFLFGSSVIYASFHSLYFLRIYERLGIGFNYTRWYFLLPAMWYAVWSVLLANTLSVADNRSRATLACGALLLAQVALNTNDYTGKVTSDRPTFAEFTSTELFDNVKQKLDLRPGELVGCVGFHPSAARYNELETIGFYRTSYSLEEKEKITRIIQPVLDRSPVIARYFNHWGSRAYLFDDEIGTFLGDQRRFRQIPSIEVNFDAKALEAAKVKYLLSTIPFRNADHAGYDLVHKDDNGYYRMFVYRVY